MRQCTAGLGFGLVRQTRLVTAASEPARDTRVHGGGGRLEITVPDNGRTGGPRMCFVDQGPGIRDLEPAMTDGYTSGGGLGLGLSGAERLLREFSVDTEPGRGTTVTAVAWVAQLPASRPGAR
ncbi:ATP-binding protein [Streptomyces sp. NPDC040750]|uniref:ATP-binding protein n=1 Tax=Streptomyces sp. NPDC040750 TaxID=3154491 RepID=UPI0033DF75B2